MQLTTITGVLWLVVLLVPAIVQSANAEKRGELCVVNNRNEVLRAWWSQDNFDATPAQNRICWTVSLPAHYRITTADDRLIRELRFSEVTEVTIQPCESKIDCNGRGTCNGVRCTCDLEKDGSASRWTGARCERCADGRTGPNCDQVCRSNGVLEPGEECDDGNDVANDGCSNCVKDEKVVILEWSLLQIWVFIVLVSVLVAWGCEFDAFRLKPNRADRFV
eukprot:TRINITY_DN1724_c0_g2_i1.p1 TRINITY_DN1724_c0_g2~~TRINITY_DN1724_c0_g2_i1.p1  ORF type:complete len:229 (-),score=32.23 TRINITY_DN1724_c0_g2_i1:9-671(-)